MNIYREEQTGEGWLSIPRYNLSFSICIQNMNLLCYTAVEISLTKNIDRKKKRTNTGKNKQEKAHSQSLQLSTFIVITYTKYEVSILNRFGDIFDEKVLRNYGRTDGRTDKCEPVYPPPPPLFQSGGIKMGYFYTLNNIIFFTSDIH